MEKTSIVAAFFWMCVLGCANHSDSSVTGCFSYEKNGDHIELLLIDSGAEVRGEMDYSLSGKDRNAGKVKGFQQGNLLVLNFTFQSEGEWSVRQVAFKVEGEKLTEGFGSMREENGKMVFNDPKKLHFPRKIMLRKVSCD